MAPVRVADPAVEPPPNLVLCNPVLRRPTRRVTFHHPPDFPDQNRQSYRTPHRVQALALVFMLALVVRNWLEAYVRARLAETDQKLPNFNDKLISRPTAENVLYLFRAVTVIARGRFGTAIGHGCGRTLSRENAAVQSGPLAL